MDAPSGPREEIVPRLTPAVGRSLDVLELFLGVQETLSAPEITELLGLPRTTVHELVHTLLARGYLEQDRAREYRYRLGRRLFELGSAYSQRLDLAQIGAGVADDLAGRCNETVNVAVLDGAEVIYVAKADSTRTVRMVSAVGRRLPAQRTAVGKVLLAELPESELAERLGGARQTGTAPARPVERLALLAELADVHRLGFAVERCESNADVCCAAAPVRDHTMRVVAAVSVSVPAARWNDVPEPTWAAVALDGARRLSTALGAPLDAP